MKSNYYGVPTQGSDGNILMEFVAMERIWSESSGQDSYDPYTCAVRSAAFLECLDIAGARTLGNSLADAVAYNITGTSGDLNTNFYAVLALEGLLNMTGQNASTTNLFGADVTCDGKVVGDGGVNAYDMAALMWYQFKFEPYDTLDKDPSVVVTVHGRDDTRFRCDLGETRRMWNLAIGDDYCHNGQNREMLGYGTGGTGRRMSQGLVPISDRPGYDLLAAYGTGNAGRLYDSAPTMPTTRSTLAFDARETRTPESRRSAIVREDMLRGVNAMWTLDIDVVEWAKVPGSGRWIRMRVPGVQVVLELYLAGIAVDKPVPLSLQAAPPMNCTTCEPADEDPQNVVILFARRSEYANEYATALSQKSIELCSDIVPATLQSTVMIGNTIALRQQPPNKACAFDVFLWVPELPAAGIHLSQQSAPYSFAARRLAAVGAESPLLTANTGCGHDIGVLAGSSALDGFRGKVQRSTSCTTYSLTGQEPINPPPPPPGTCPVSCNPHAPRRSDIVSTSFQSRSIATLVQSIYSSSLRLMRAIAARSTSRSAFGLRDYVQFELMLGLESESNACCPGFTCVAQNTTNQTLGMCQPVATPPSAPPGMLPTVPPSASPNAPPPPTTPPQGMGATLVGVLVVSLVGVAGMFCCCFGMRAVAPPDKDCCDENNCNKEKGPLLPAEGSMQFSSAELARLPKSLRRQAYKNV